MTIMCEVIVNNGRSNLSDKHNDCKDDMKELDSRMCRHLRLIIQTSVLLVTLISGDCRRLLNNCKIIIPSRSLTDDSTALLLISNCLIESNTGARGLVRNTT